MRTLVLLIAFACVLPAAEEYSYWIEDCTPETARSTSCEPGDPELGRWALEAWQRESGGAIILKKSPNEEHARLRLHWANGTSSLYGETEPTMVDGKRGANIYVLPSVGPGRAEPLTRDTIVYLTCVHESGHALGLVHTRNFADIMYSFQYGRHHGLLPALPCAIENTFGHPCAFRDLRRGPHRAAPGAQSVTDSAFHHCEKFAYGSPVPYRAHRAQFCVEPCVCEFTFAPAIRQIQVNLLAAYDERIR